MIDKRNYYEQKWLVVLLGRSPSMFSVIAGFTYSILRFEPLEKSGPTADNR
jgi:hypothetical protein